MQIAQLSYLPPPNIMPLFRLALIKIQCGRLWAICYPKHTIFPVQPRHKPLTSLFSPLRAFSWLLTRCCPFWSLILRLLKSVSHLFNRYIQGNLTPPDPLQLAQRILVSYILYSLYAPHPIAINPFKSVLFVTFNKERDQAIRVSSGGATSPNEQLVWVLWKILKGDGNDVS